jgi:hypothetical protein
MEKYLTRVTPNKNGWQYPSGCECKCGGELYENTFGFGWEEWLFNKCNRKDDFQYGFLQCFNTQNINEEVSYDEVYLYTRKCETKDKDCKNKSRKGKCYLVARIYNLTKLNHDEATKIEKAFCFPKNGNKNQMSDKCNENIREKLRFKLKPNGNNSIFNVKFKIEDAKLIDIKKELTPSNYRFVLMNIASIQNLQKRNSIINSINQSSFNQNI